MLHIAEKLLTLGTGIVGINATPQVASDIAQLAGDASNGNADIVNGVNIFLKLIMTAVTLWHIIKKPKPPVTPTPTTTTPAN